MLTQVDYEGFTTTMMEEIINHDRDENTAANIKDKYVKHTQIREDYKSPQQDGNCRSYGKTNQSHGYI
eukprot:13526412-Ditylum_brightwellii.AAC.1